MKNLGVIGGLGPMATAYFMQLVIEMTDAKTDQEHIPMMIYNCPQIPDRTSFFLGKSKENPATKIIECGKLLEQVGVDVLAMPCITAHVLFEQIQKEVSVPMIHIVEETAKYLRKEGICRVGLEATDGTIWTGIFQKELERQGMEVVLPSKEKQDMVMHIIYNNVKAGRRVDMERFEQIEQELHEKGAEVIILGCTELSMISRDEKIGHGYLDAMEVLAKTAVLQCGKLKNKYDKLIT